MPRLPKVKPRLVIKFLERNGFVLDHVLGIHFIFHHPISRRGAHARNSPAYSDVRLPSPWSRRSRSFWTASRKAARYASVCSSAPLWLSTTSLRAG